MHVAPMCLSVTYVPLYLSDHFHLLCISLYHKFINRNKERYLSMTCPWMAHASMGRNWARETKCKYVMNYFYFTFHSRSDCSSWHLGVDSWSNLYGTRFACRYLICLVFIYHDVLQHASRKPDEDELAVSGLCDFEILLVSWTKSIWFWIKL